MRLKIPCPLHSSVILSVLLGLLVVMSVSSPVPVVSISSVQDLDEGTEIRVIGVVSDLRRYDSGTEAIVLVDLDDGRSVSVYCIEGMGDPPGTYANIGDELSVTGTVMRSAGLATILTSPSQVVLSRTSEYVLSCDLLSENWQSFLNDEICIRGRVVEDTLSGGARLGDESGHASIQLWSSSTDLATYIGSCVVLSGQLQMDLSRLALCISVDLIRPQQ
ncbi:MAG: hypothetical protein MUC90_00550 [Thermoplasmata archaeon]|jgi:hypothetical protein|nr:hypothetical protein [Thermoplasmata archaeon]